MSKSDDFFGGAPSLSWARETPDGQWVDIPELLNVSRGGVITAVGEPVQMTEIGTGKPLWWKEPTATEPGQPKVKLVITLRCDRSTGRGVDERNHADPSDLGERQLHVQSKDMRDAIGAASRKTGNRGVSVGSELYVKWTGKRASRIKGANPARTWDALYVPHAIDVTDDGRNPQPVGPAAQQPAWPPRPDGGQVPTPAPATQPNPAPAAPPQPPPDSVPPWAQPAAQAPPAAPVPPWEQPRPAGPPPASPWEQPQTAAPPAQPGW